MLFHGVYILSTQPLIVSIIGDYPFSCELLYQFTSCGKGLSSLNLPDWFRPKYVLEHIAGWSVPWHRMSRFKAKQFLHTLEGRKHHLIVNALDEDVVRKRFLARGEHFTSSLYINEHLYQPLDEPKIYDAIYTAQLAAFKRHSLAKKIEKLMVVSYGGDLHAFCPELKHAEFNQSFLPRPELAKKYNQSHTGLCLSAVEGAMFASCEYLLCGIPVVSTPSKGGRDEFFDQENSLIVAPDPEAIAQAVEQWKKHPPDPYQIRHNTLSRLNRIRQDYCAYIADLIEQDSGYRYHPDALMEKYFSPPDGSMSRFVKLEDLWKFSLDDFSYVP